MREIKFRAWSKQYNEMYYDVQDEYDGGIADSFGMLLDDKSFEIMQFTGLYDRNGKEIYEGDIVNVYYSKNAAHTKAGMINFEKCVITFDGGCFCVNTPAMIPENYASIPIYMSGEIEIIGNIYETKN